ncbi:MAG: pilus assembly protein TadG-related protein [Acidimicrobiia bacterium]
MATPNSDRGYAALLTAAALLFLLGAAALAVDTSMFFQQARSEQRVADLACLAGAQELPEDPVNAVTMAAEFLRPNHPDLAGLNPNVTDDLGPPVAGVPNTYTWGAFTIEIETPWNGKATQMRVSVSQDRGTHFGRAIGANTVEINQEAFCEVGSALGAGADMPFGVLLGFTGGIVNFEQNQCTLNDQSSDTCSGLKIPRHDDPPGSEENNPTGNYIANMIAGINWNIDPSVNQLCEVGSNEFEPCNRIATTSGSDPNKIYDGLIAGRSSLGFAGADIGYLERHHTIYCHVTDCYDGHTLEDVADCNGAACPTPRDTVTWEQDIANGTFVPPPPVTLSAIDDCDCPRFARIPIVESFPTSDCTVTDPEDATQVNKCTARVIGFEWVYLMRPYYNGDSPPNAPGEFFDDFGGNMGETVQTIAAVALDFAPDIDVESGCFSEFTEGAPKAVRLING